MKVLIKLGGSLLDDAVLCASIAAQIAALPAGVSAVIVHGGGKQMTRYLAARGVESRFMDGLRVTTPEVADALLKVYAGSVNKQLVERCWRPARRGWASAASTADWRWHGR